MSEEGREEKSEKKRVEITGNCFWYIKGKKGTTIADTREGLSRELAERINDSGTFKDSTVIRVEIDAEEGTVDAQKLRLRDYVDDVFQRIKESNKGNDK